MSTELAERINFSSIKNASAYPDFLDIQIKSFKDFFQLETKSDERGEEGLYNTFQDNFPITDVKIRVNFYNDISNEPIDSVLGDTILDSKNDTSKPLPGFQKVLPKVFSPIQYFL